MTASDATSTPSTERPAISDAAARYPEALTAYTECNETLRRLYSGFANGIGLNTYADQLITTISNTVEHYHTSHAEAVDSECPDGLPNCRNCGDPAHEEACRAAGHCPLCGTVHGIAPNAHLAANGYRLDVVT